MLLNQIPKKKKGSCQSNPTNSTKLVSEKKMQFPKRFQVFKLIAIRKANTIFKYNFIKKVTEKGYKIDHRQN